MNCGRYQQLLHLNRPGEISEAEAANLRRHLTHCESCSLEWERIGSADKFLDPLRTFSPASSEPDKLTAGILRRVRKTEAIEGSRSVIDRIFDFFLIRAVRYSTVAVILAVMMTLTIQSLTLIDHISDLEQRFGSMTIRDDGATYSVRSETLREVVKSEKIQSPTGGVPFAVTNGRVQAPAKDVDSFLSAANLRNLSAIIGSSALRVDQKTLEKIVSEIKATAKLTFRAG